MTLQKTIAKSVSISGTGIHTGKNVTLTFNPAEPNTGFVFKRIDLPGQPVIKALVDFVFDTSRGTSLKSNEVIVRTVEHVLAALIGLDIDNAIIDIDQEETPIMDGSSQAFVEVLLQAGAIEQDAERKVYDLNMPIRVVDEEKNVEMNVIPDEGFRVSTLIDYNNPAMTPQSAMLNNISEFAEGFSKARTFVFLSEIEVLINNNLIKGGDINRALVFVDKSLGEEQKKKLTALFNQQEVAVPERGVLNNKPLNYDNEPARHKLLDIVGDMALVGFKFNAHIIANRPGHKTNVELAKRIRQAIQQKSNESPVAHIDITQTPLYDIEGIKKLLPHRPPFLLVDKILEKSDRHIIGIKAVTMNEGFFVGHFPQEAVMPGVLQIEAMAQTGGIMILTTVPDPENYVTYFLKIDGVKFRSRVVPGDVIIFHLELASPIRRGLCHMFGKAYVGDKLVMEAEMMAQIVKK